MAEKFLPMSFVAEQAVCAYLARRGYHILSQNYQYRGFELDIVSTDGRTLVLTEVKFRNQGCKSIDLSALIPPNKKRCLAKGIKHFLNKTQAEFDTIRCDLALACLESFKGKIQKKPYNLKTGIRLYYHEDISLET